ncbi:MAG TPA: alpha/beta hydrolase, partial [Candidatus Manganitrophaceae bacterium]|nr:alpha/beta hydrolase [Candidatus Manganitrophaceae bacterium]
QIDALLPEIKRPVLILWGENDRWLSEEHLIRLQERLPNNQALKISRCGHLPHIDKPKEVAAAAIRFME